MVDSLTSRTERQPKCKRPLKRRKHMRVLVHSWFNGLPLLFYLPFCFFPPLSNANSNAVNYRYNRVDQNNRAYYNTDFRHRRVRRQSIGIVAELQADLRRATQ